MRDISETENCIFRTRRRGEGGCSANLSFTVFSGKQNNIFWNALLETGRTPHGTKVLVKWISLIGVVK